MQRATPCEQSSLHPPGKCLRSAVCRKEKKPGVCPKLLRENPYASCDNGCDSDSDCDGDQKCCYNGCGRSCLKLVRDPGEDLLDKDDEVLGPEDPNAPKIRVTHLVMAFLYQSFHFAWIFPYHHAQVLRPSVAGSEGDVVVLTVYVSGNPTPDVYWRKGPVDDIDTSKGKFRLINGGSLQVKQ